MPKRISQKTKQLRRMGTGKGANYIPYITTSEFNSKGTTSVIKDWKTDFEGVHLGSWFHTQIKSYEAGNMSKRRIDKMKEINPEIFTD